MKFFRIFLSSMLFNIIATVLLVFVFVCFLAFFIPNHYKLSKIDVDGLTADYLDKQKENEVTAKKALDAIGDNNAVCEITEDLIVYCHDNIDSDIYNKICDYMETNVEYNDSMWEKLCGYSLHALYDLSSGAANAYNYSVIDSGDYFTLAFAGDVSLDSPKTHTWSPLVVHKNNISNILENAFDSEISRKMIGADLFCVNLESPFVSSNAKPIDWQWYRYGSDIANTSILTALGIDIVNIANNHIYDYGKIGFEDNLSALSDTKIAYIGGGINLQDAKTPRYIIAGGKKIAIISALQESNAYIAPEASEKASGVIYSTNSAYFASMIADAEKNSDYVIVLTDWTDGNAFNPDASQTNLAHSFIDAGADIIIGTKSTIMQPIEYYMGKPIFYSIGNFWHETDRHETVFVELSFEKNAVEPTIAITPCIQDNAIVRSVLGSGEGTQIFNKLTSLSKDSISIDENGIVTSISQDQAEN